jgi:GNAT superfamily N-acetyltransferase
LAAHINPVLQHLGPHSQDAISNLLRRSGRPGAHEPHLVDRESPGNGPELAPRNVRWMAGVYLADELTGLVRVRDGPSEGHVEAMLFVDARWRRQGIGTMLLKATLEWATLHQASTLRFVCARTDWPMRQLARKFGARLDLVLGELIADIPLAQGIHQQHAASSG